MTFQLISKTWLFVIFSDVPSNEELRAAYAQVHNQNVVTVNNSIKFLLFFIRLIGIRDVITLTTMNIAARRSYLMRLLYTSQHKKAFVYLHLAIKRSAANKDLIRKVEGMTFADA